VRVSGFKVLVQVSEVHGVELVSWQMLGSNSQAGRNCTLMEFGSQVSNSVEGEPCAFSDTSVSVSGSCQGNKCISAAVGLLRQTAVNVRRSSIREA
jgi:hypothetical protein